MDDATRRSIAERREAALARLRPKTTEPAKQLEAARHPQASVQVNPPPQGSSSANLQVEPAHTPEKRQASRDALIQALHPYKSAYCCHYFRVSPHTCGNRNIDKPQKVETVFFKSKGDLTSVSYIVFPKNNRFVFVDFPLPNDAASGLFEFLVKVGPHILRDIHEAFDRTPKNLYPPDEFAFEIASKLTINKGGQCFETPESKPQR